MATASDITPAMVASIKGMLKRGDRQFDIATWWNLPLTHVSNIATGLRKGTRQIEAAPAHLLPAPGPYQVVSVDAHTRLQEAAAVPLRTLEAIMERLVCLQNSIDKMRQETLHASPSRTLTLCQVADVRSHGQQTLTTL